MAVGRSVMMQWLRSLTTCRGTTIADLGSKEGELRVFMVCGEVSGDILASRLMSSLKSLLSPLPIRFAGIGGSLMSKEGLQHPVFPMEDIAVMGIWELLPHLTKIKANLKLATDSAFLFHPHVVVTVDSKGFSFRLLKQLQARYNGELRGPLHVHYVAPSFWAWKGGEARLRGLKEFVDHVLCILPFEEEICRSNGLNATYVGHPILEDALDLNSGKGTTRNDLKVHCKGASFREKYGISSGGSVITVLPGSRLQEVTRMLPIFSDTMGLLKELLPDLTTVIPVARNQHVESYVDSAIGSWPVPNILIPGGLPLDKYKAFSASAAALSTSGTAVMELQFAQLPCVVAYRAHFLTEWFIRFKAKVPYISLPNILLDSAAIPELLFGACTPKNLATCLKQVIHVKSQREKQIDASEKVMELLSSSLRERLPQEVRSRFPNWTPSMIAASTILYSMEHK